MEGTVISLKGMFRILSKVFANERAPELDIALRLIIEEMHFTYNNNNSSNNNQFPTHLEKSPVEKIWDIICNYIW